MKVLRNVCFALIVLYLCWVIVVKRNHILIKYHRTETSNNCAYQLLNDVYNIPHAVTRVPRAITRVLCVISRATTRDS